MHSKETSPTVVWPLFVRLTHWLVAACVLVNFFNESGFWHRAIGYVCVGLVLLRIIEGVLINKETTASLYCPGFSAIQAHINALFSGRVQAHVGHNPLGQLAVYVMWLLMILLALTGWLSRTDQYWGEDWPVDMHAMLSDALLGMVILHLLAVVLMSKLQGSNLMRAMLRGK